MKGLPDSKIYEQGLKYWPYADSWKRAFNYICDNTPINGTLIDLMCGPGYLLKKLQLKRKDLELSGVDIDKRYILYAKKTYPKIKFELADILKWKFNNKYDVVICTGSLHHIIYNKQEKVIRKMASMVKKNGFVLISDCCIDPYLKESQRMLNAAKLGYEYIKETIKNGAPSSIIGPTIDILYNDVLMKEFKTSPDKRIMLLEKIFKKVEIFKTWPKFKSEYGDYIFICRNIR